MKSKANHLRANFPFKHLLHSTCVAHASHNICDEVRDSFPKANKLIMGTKSFLVKATKRRKILRQTCPELKFPPAPVPTRWGTFLRAPKYYANDDNRKELIKAIEAIRNEELKNVPKKVQTQIQQQNSSQNQQQRQQNQPGNSQNRGCQKHTQSTENPPKQQQRQNDNEGESSTLREIKKADELLAMLRDEETIQQLKFLAQHYEFLPIKIKILETHNLPPAEVFQHLTEIGDTLKSIPNAPPRIHEKYESVFAKNDGFVCLSKYFNEKEITGPLALWSTKELKCLQHVILTTSLIERAFSVYKIMFRTNRRAFLFKNFRKFVISKSILQTV